MSAVREALFGNAEEARRAAFALHYSAGIDVQYGSALALAYAGNDRQAQSLMDEQTKAAKLDCGFQLSAHDPQVAIRRKCFRRH